MRVLVAYASAYGSTKGIAERIGGRLAAEGADVDIRRVDDVDGIEGYDAVVLGSAVHGGAWLPDAAAFARASSAGLAARAVWLFSVSSVGDTSAFFGPQVARFLRRARHETEETAAWRQAFHPRGHRNFAGAIARSHWGRLADLFFRLFGGNYGDHRDWADVDAWADAIAMHLGIGERPVGV